MSTIEHIDRNEGREKSMKQVRWAGAIIKKTLELNSNVSFHIGRVHKAI
jgi:hypothetical protein